MPALDSIRRRPVVAYFLAAFLITWSLVWLLAALPAVEDPDTASRTRFIGLVGAMLAGPSLAALLLTLITEGTAGVRALVSALTRLGDARSWVVGFGTAPLLILLSLGAMLAARESAFTPGFAASGLIAGLAVAAFEEFGWTGFATPRLIERFGAVPGGLLLGVLWALWHAPADLVGNAGMPLDIWAVRFTLFFLIPLTAYRVLMTIIYARTRSPALAIVMHASWTGGLLTLSPNVGAIPALTWYLLLALLTVAAAILAARADTQSVLMNR